MRHLDEQVLRYDAIPRKSRPAPLPVSGPGMRSKRVEREGMMMAIAVGFAFVVVAFGLLIHSLR